jgi:hypothetical protein
MHYYGRVLADPQMHYWGLGKTFYHGLVPLHHLAPAQIAVAAAVAAAATATGVAVRRLRPAGRHHG